MAESIKKKDLAARLAERMGTDAMTAEAWLDATFEEMYQVFKSGKGITLTGFGGFYLDQWRQGTVFKFNPGQKLKALLGWSSTYKGDL